MLLSRPNYPNAVSLLHVVATAHHRLEEAKKTNVFSYSQPWSQPTQIESTDRGAPKPRDEWLPAVWHTHEWNDTYLAHARIAKPSTKRHAKGEQRQRQRQHTAIRTTTSERPHTKPDS